MMFNSAHLPWQKRLDGFYHQHLEPKHWQGMQVLCRFFAADRLV
jgi:hypothetical protein